jgi:hypothetical protein
MSDKFSPAPSLKAFLVLVAAAAAVVSIGLLPRPGRPAGAAAEGRKPSGLSQGERPGQSAGYAPAGGEASQIVRRQVSEAYGKLPLSFEANRGQAGGDVKFLSRGDGFQLLLSADGATFSFADVNRRGKTRRRESARVGRLKLGLSGARPASSVSGEGELAGKANYLRGGDPAGWVTGVETYSKVKYGDVYPGVDLVYYGNRRQLEYDFNVAAGADPSLIRLAFEGARRVEIDARGDLLLRTPGGLLRMKRPVAYQEREGVRREVASRYVVRGRDSVGFRLGEYDPALPLVIDPVLVYSTFTGGTGDDAARAIAVDSAGNAYVTGRTLSVNYPATPGAFQTEDGADPTGFVEPGLGLGDVFVTKLNAAGNGAVYSTYVGGQNDDEGRAVAVDAAGNAYVAGVTYSTDDFPVTPGAFQTTAPPVINGAFMADAFVLKLNPSGSGLAYSTRVATSANDEAQAVALDASGAAYVTGFTDGSTFPVTAGASQPASGGYIDVFVTKLNPAGSALAYSTYFGGTGADYGRAVAVDGDGSAYVTGWAQSSNFPVTPGAIQTSFKGNDAFVAKWGPTGALVYSTLLGGDGDDSGQGIDVDGSGNAYVTGYTEFAGFPVTAGAYQTVNGFLGSGFYDAFVSKVNPQGTQLVYSTYLGTPNKQAVETGYDIAVNAAGEAFVSGSTNSADFPVTADAAQKVYGGGLRDAFLVRLNAAGSGLLYSTFLGGGGTDLANAVAVDASGNAYVAGLTRSGGFPVTPGSFQKAIGGGNTDQSAFVAKIGTALPVSYSIGGRVTDGTNAAAGVLMRLSGSLEGTQWTAADGSYSFGNLPPGGTYTVTPSSPFYDFGSQSRTFANLSADQTADFAGLLLRFSLSGTVTDAAGQALAGVTVALNNNQGSTQTDSAGHYAFDNLPAVGTYVVTPSKTDYLFAPFARRLDNLNGNQTADFRGTLAFSIKGRVVSTDGKPLTSLAVRLTGTRLGRVSPDADGNYAFNSLPAGGTYTVTPELTAFDFSPPSRTFENLGGHQTADFAATYKFGSLSGRVTDEGGKGLYDVRVVLTGGPQPVASNTDTNGNYSFSQLTKGVNYTLTASQLGFTFEPATFGRVVAGDHRVDFYARRNKLKPFGANHLVIPTTGPYQTSSYVVSEYTLDGQLVQSALAPFPGEIPPFSSLYPGDLVLDKYGDVQMYTGTGETSYLTGSDIAHVGWKSHTYPGWNPWVLYNSFEGIATWGDYVFVTDKLQADFGKPVQTQGIIRIDLRDFSAQRFEQDRIYCHLTAGKDGLLYGVEGGTSGYQLRAFNPETMALVKTVNLSVNVRQIAVNQKGEIYAAEFELDHFDNTGKLIRRIDLEGNLSDVEVADDGTVATASYGIITIIDAADNVVRSFRAPAGYIAFTNTPPPPASAFRFGAAAYAADEGAGSVQVEVRRQGDTSAAASVTYSTADDTAQQTKDYTAAYGTLNFAPGETSKSFGVILTDNAYADGSRTVALRLTDSTGAPLSSPGTATLTITDNDAPGQSHNPVDDTGFFVRQHYADFLNRVPDPSGLQFWTGGVESCGADAGCREVKRIDTSAAFFLAIEFQEEGYLVYRMYKAAYGDATSPNVAGTVPVVRLDEFLPDTQRIGRGVVVNVGAWEQQLEANKNAYALEFVLRPRFQTAFPSSMTAAQFVDKLVRNAGLTLTQAERDQLASELSSATDTNAARASILRRLAEHQQLRQAEFNRAFVLMQYFGYLRRNPDDAPDANFGGWKFWLDKLDEFGGDYRRAEMVKAFLSSTEYRRRFAQ